MTKVNAKNFSNYFLTPKIFFIRLVIMSINSSTTRNIIDPSTTIQ